MATRKRGGLQFFANFESVAKSIGAAWGVMEAMDSKDYQQSLIENGFNVANLDFNREAAAFAATGAIKHMYEWGTLGINTGRTNVRPDPMSERARLWNPTMQGTGFHQQLDFDFKPSVAFVPKPTSRDTGMDPAVIELMRDHIFWNKAMVMESGMTVSISPREAEFLLIPLYKGNDYPAARPYDFKRGYMLQSGPNVFRPGAKSAGRFNAYWVAFWEGRGNQILNDTIEEQWNKDYEISQQTTGRQAMHPPIPAEVTTAVTEQKKREARNARRRARYAAKKAEEARRAQ